MKNRIEIPFNLWIIIISGSIYSYFFSPNFFLITPILFYIPFIYKLFFVKGNPNIIFWGLLFQWLTVSSQPIYATILGVPLRDLFKNSLFPSELLFYTDTLSIIGIYIYSIGLYIAVKKSIKNIDESIWDLYDPKKLLIIYIYVSFFIAINSAIIWNFPSLVQYVYFLFYIKWGFFIVTFMMIFKKAPYLKIPIFSIIIIEFILGLSTYFASSFYIILLFTAISYSAVTLKINLYKTILAIFFGAMLFHFAILWTAAKGNYRTYVNQGENIQAVKVSNEEARTKLLELVGNIDNETYFRALEDVVNRIGYIQYFSAAIRYVPNVTPHEYGKVYMRSIAHFLIPRFIDPNKPELDDSKHTNQYTGLNLSGKSKSTSFSLGSFADAYIDFGPIFMFIPIFLFGYVIGFFFQYLYTPDLWGLILTGPFFLLINIYGTDTTKAIGFILIYFLTIYFLKKTLKSYIDPLIRLNK